MFGVNVKGGSGAGSKRDHSPYIPWECNCPHPIWKGEKNLLPGYVKRCVDCGTEHGSA
jgi:hypothetical protein